MVEFGTVNTDFVSEMFEMSSNRRVTVMCAENTKWL